MGFSNAIIHSQNISKNQLSTLFWINFFCGISIFFIILLAKKYIADFFNMPILNHYLTYIAVLFLFIPVPQIFNTLLTKELRFKTLCIVETITMVIFVVSTFIFLIMGFGILSLIFGVFARITSSILFYFLIFRKVWMPKIYFNFSEIQNLLSFGMFQMGEKIINYLTSNIDYIIIGRYLGHAALGYYTLAYEIVVYPLLKLNPIITKVMFPAFSKFQNDNVILQEGFCKTIKYIAVVITPLLAGLFLCSPDFINLFFGNEWQPSIKLIQILCLVGLLKSIGNPIGTIYLAKGKANIGFFLNLIYLPILMLALWFSVPWGAEGVAIAVLSCTILLFSIAQPMINHLIDLKFKKYFKSLFIPLASSSVILIMLIFLQNVFSDLDQITRITLNLGFGFTSYILFLFATDRKTIDEIQDMIRKN